MISLAKCSCRKPCESAEKQGMIPDVFTGYTRNLCYSGVVLTETSRRLLAKRLDEGE